MQKSRMRDNWDVKVVYRKPVAKRVNTNIFFLNGIYSFHTGGSGKAKIAESDKQLSKPEPSTSRQRPLSQGI